ncbi:MAG: hypothetical protein AMJ58_12320 [Gammaproteobacteria bacterium SG8_30]|nr:MAG: hypothetical protein AMJ58_12320 [Gammaproteobacteria bacterium SG8_30]
MSKTRPAALLCLLGLGPGLAAGQTPDAASERARLGNQRTQAEAERRMREEREVQRAAPDVLGESTGETSRQPGTPTSSGVVDPTGSYSPPRSGPSSMAAGSVAPPRPPATDDELTERALKQLRDLGELKDAGYVTDEEFQRIKQRILERQF